MGQGYLEQFQDTALEVDMGWDPEAYRVKQVERLTRLYLMAAWAEGVPRRLGGEATSAELRKDKKLCRVFKSRSLSLLRLWTYQVGSAKARPTDEDGLVVNLETLDEETRIAGAQVIWPEWWAERKQFLQRELTVVASTALRTGHLKVGNSYVNRLVNEIAQLQQVIDLHT